MNIIKTAVIGCGLAGLSLLAEEKKSFQEVKVHCVSLAAAKTKHAELKEAVREAVSSGRFTERQCRDLMNLYGGAVVWSDQWFEGLRYLYAAARLEAPRDSNEHFATYRTIATILFRRRGMPEAALVILEDVLLNKSLHPANGYSACMTAGAACEELGDVETALGYYRRAVDYGKQVKYKFDIAPAEKAVERMEKMNSERKTL